MDIELPKNLRLIKLPVRVELVLYLIKAELKNKKFNKHAEHIGFDSSHFSYDFGPIIMCLTGIEIKTDQIYEWYSGLVDRYIKRIDEDDSEETLTETAFDFLIDVEIEKRMIGKSA